MSFKNYQWHIFRATLDPVTGSEQRGTRPVLVVSDEDFNELMPVVTILPLTSRKPGRSSIPTKSYCRKVLPDCLKTLSLWHIKSEPFPRTV